MASGIMLAGEWIADENQRTQNGEFQGHSNK